ncbi:MAG: hypothetical protein ACYS1A_17575 [Planctomycetota bacterium]|jgi:hypothetical protein
MAATVATYYYNGGVPSGAAATNLRFKLADNNTQDTNNPCVVPAAGTNRSWWKCIALFATVAPDTAINNVFIYSDGAMAWTGCTLQIGYDGSDYGISTYSQAITGGANTGAEVVANYVGISSVSDLFSFTAASPASVSGSISYVTGKITDYVVLQVDIDNTAGPGAMPVETLTWRYDET